MARVTRRMALAALGAGGLVGLGYVVRSLFDSPSPSGSGMMGSGSGMMGSAAPEGMSAYMDMFNRHTELRRVVEEIPGGVRTTTESDSADLVARLQAHVSDMHTHLAQGAEVTCMSQSLPVLFRRADGYHRQLTYTPKGVIAEETASDPDITRAIREHAGEVTGFVREGMPAMMNQMMRPGR
jgi:hypothetical protein